MPEGLRPVVLVTGASGGIGAALAGEFAAGGHDLFLVSRSADKLEALGAGLRDQHNVRTDILVLDLVSPDAGGVLEAAVAGRGLYVDVLVNNAGFGVAGPAANMGRADQLEMIDLNIRALVDLTLRFLPGQMKRGQGGVLNVGSIAGFQPGPNMAVYYASKAFVGSFTEALATEAQAHGVRFTNLAPGPVATGFARRAGMKRSPLFRSIPGQSAEAVAHAGYSGFTAGKRLVVPGIFNRLSVILGRLVPRRIRDIAIMQMVKTR